ncbi:MAG: hypothetical protein JST22_05025 [Bacteroidetes bacterium]|nr:hypothetical protein [Bacteroidota bacterium]
MADNLMFSNVIYDPGTLYAEWTATIPPHFTGYQVTLTAGSASQNFETQVPHITINRILEPNVGHTLTVTMMAGGRPTSQSMTVDLITAAPIMTLVDNSGTTVRYHWTAAQGPNVQGYVAILTQTGSSIWTVSTDAATLTATFDRHLSSAAAYTSVVRATNTDGVVLGPPSETLVPLTTTPADPTVAPAGAQMIVGWITEANPKVTSYVADLLANGASVGARQAQGPPAIFEPALVAGTIYTATVRSAGTRVLGPWVPPVTGPYADNAVLAYEAAGRVETITWNSSGSITYDYEDVANTTAAGTAGR